MQVFDAIKNRRSIRAYREEPISKEYIEKLLEVARIAPSAGNGQNWKFIVVNNKDIKKRFIIACNNQTFVSTAPHIIVGTVDPDQKWHQVDIAIALEHIVLEAVELGLGTCWIGSFNEDSIKKILNISQDRKIVALLTVGYPAEDPPQRPRKKMSDIVQFIS